MKIIYEETSKCSSEVEKYLQVLVDQDINILLHDDMFYHGPGHRIHPGMVEGKLIGIGYYELDDNKTMVHLIVTSKLSRSNQWCSFHELTDSMDEIRKFSSDKFKEIINELLIDHHNSAIKNYSPKCNKIVQLLK